MNLVVGASGHLGSHLVSGLIERGEPVRATSRTPEASLGVARKLGAETARLDLRDAASIRDAVRGIERLFIASQGLFPPSRKNHPGNVDRTGNRRLIDAAKRAGVDRVVFSSVPDARPDSPAKWWRIKHETVAYLQESGLPHTVLKFGGVFTEFHGHRLIGEPLQAGKPVRMFGPGTTRLSWISVDDAADRVLDGLGDAPHAPDSITIRGADELTRLEALRIYERAIGVDAKVKHVPVVAMRALRAVTGPVHPGLHHVLDTAVVEATRPDWTAFNPPDADSETTTSVVESAEAWARAAG